MIGSGLKKLAKEHGMTVDKGVAYGSLMGYAATLSEGGGWKRVVFTTKFADPARKMALIDLTGKMDLKKQYRVLDLSFFEDGIGILFHDNPGTMKKMVAFLEWFVPLMGQHSAQGVQICTQCGCEITAGRWAMVNGITFYLHDSCAQKLQREVEEENTQRKEADNGNYVTGLLGALAGSAAGAIVWAVVLYMGYVASIVGLLIGWLAEKGYNLFRGKQGKAKVLILIIAIIFGVLLGTFAADAYTLGSMIAGGELPGVSMGEIPGFILYMLADSEEYRSATISNILMGLLFAALGVFTLLRQAGKGVADSKYIELR